MTSDELSGRFTVLEYNIQEISRRLQLLHLRMQATKAVQPESSVLQQADNVVESIGMQIRIIDYLLNRAEGEPPRSANTIGGSHE